MLWAYKVYRRVLLGVILSALSISIGYAADASTALMQQLSALKSFQADFTQQIMAPNQPKQQSHGKIWLTRPDKFRWQVQAPFAQTVVSDGQQVYLYDPDLEQVSIRTLDQKVSNTPALLLSGRSNELASHYVVNVRYVGSRAFFTLTPKEKDNLFAKLELVFDQNQLVAFNLTDVSDQQTAITFTQIEQNKTISSERFTFEIPKNTEVIRE